MSALEQLLEHIEDGVLAARYWARRGDAAAAGRLLDEVAKDAAAASKFATKPASTHTEH